MPNQYQRLPPEREKTAVAASRDVKGSPWGGGGFVDYAGQGVDAYNTEQHYLEKRKQYEKEIRDREVKEADADFGKLQSEVSGVGGIDASTEAMAREWKSDYVVAKRMYDNGELSPQEFSQKKNSLFQNAAEFKQASTNINTTVQEYDQAVQEGRISDSTPAEIRDILDTLRKGGEGISVKNINGIPMLVGKTAGGQDISVPITEISSGKNAWRFNEKVDIAPALDGLYGKYEKLKISAEGPNGQVTQRNPSFEELQGRIDEDVANMLNNESTLRAIASDELGIDPLAFEGREENDPGGTKAEVAAFLKDKLQREYFPTSQVTQRGFAPQRPSAASQKENPSGAKTRLVDNIAASIEATIGADGHFTEETVAQLQGQLGDNILSIEFDSNAFTPWADGPEVVIETKDGETIKSSNPQALVEQIANAKFGDKAVATSGNNINTKVKGKGKVSAKDRAAQILANRKK